jgi:hypothetical protein
MTQEGKKKMMATSHKADWRAKMLMNYALLLQMFMVVIGYSTSFICHSGMHMIRN